MRVRPVRVERKGTKETATKDSSHGEFWYACCCADYWLRHTTEGNIREEDDNSIYQKLNTPFVEATLLTLLILEIILSGADLIFESSIERSRLDMKAVFCGFGGPDDLDEMYCYGSGDAFNTTRSSYYVDRMSELKDDVRLMQILSMVTVVFSIVTVILFAVESFMFMYYLGRKFCKYPILVLDLIFVLASFLCLLVDFIYAISFCENKVSLATDYYENYFQDNPEEATSCGTPSAFYDTHSATQPFACDNQGTSKYVKHAGRLLLVFRLWRVIRVFKSIFEHQEKKSRLEASHASAMAKFVAKTILMLRQQREKDNAYLNQILGKTWSILLGVVRGDRLKEEIKKKSKTLSMKKLSLSSKIDHEPAIGASYEGVIHDIGSTVRNAVNDITSNKPLAPRRRESATFMTHDIHIVVKTVRNGHEVWDEKGKNRKFNLKDFATIDVAAVVAIRNISLHCRLVKMHGVCYVDNSDHVHLVTELLEGTGTGRSMQHYVHHESREFNERQIMQIALDMSDGLRYLHAMGLIHGNLCPSNVLLVAPYKSVSAAKTTSSTSKTSNVINKLSTDDMLRCRAAFQAVVGSNSARIGIEDFPIAARAVDCTETEVEKILASQSTQLMREENREVSWSFEEFVAITTMSRLRSSMYRAKLADPWFYRTASSRPFRIGDCVEVVDSSNLNFGGIGRVLSVGKRKIGKGKEALNIVVDLGDDMIGSFEPYSLNIVDQNIGPIGVLNEERRREITQKWASVVNRSLESQSGPSEFKNDARRHAKVLCQRKSFEKSLYRSPESTTMGRDFRSTMSRDADVYALGAIIYAVMLRQDFDVGPGISGSSGMKRFRKLAKEHCSLSDKLSSVFHHRRQSKKKRRKTKSRGSRLSIGTSSSSARLSVSSSGVLGSMSTLLGLTSGNDDDEKNGTSEPSPTIIRHRMSSSLSGLSHSSNKLSSMLGSELVDNGTIQFHRFIGKCLRTDPSARPKSVRCLNLIGECTENWHFDAASRLVDLEKQMKNIAHHHKKKSSVGASGLASIIKTSYAKTATIYKSAQTMRRSSTKKFDEEKTSGDNNEDEDEEKKTDGDILESSNSQDQMSNVGLSMPDDDFRPPPGLNPFRRS